jgi:hypothetical protein
MDAAIIIDDATAEKRLPVQASYTPDYFLAIHIIELSLKAYLLFKGGGSLSVVSSTKRNLASPSQVVLIACNFLFILLIESVCRFNQ